MTRTFVYSATLVAVVAATVMTITSAVTPHWISYSETTKLGGTVYDHIGLRQRCSTSTASGSASGRGCAHFPDEGQCESGDRYAICSMWQTTGILMSFTVVMDLVTLVSLLVVMAGGKARRESGWRAVCGMLAAVAALQFGAMAVVGYIFDNDDIFHVPGYALDASWYLCTASAVIAAACAFNLAISAYVLAPEGGYIFLGDSTGV